MIEINGKVYRNIQEQVEKNKEDIAELQQGSITVDAYTKAEADAKFATNTALAGKQDRLTTSDSISISNNEIYVDEDWLSANYVGIDSDGNLSKSLIRTGKITSIADDADVTGEITLTSGTRTGSIYLDASGEESSASIFLRGTTSIGSEGMIEISGETQFNTSNRINVYDGVNTEQIAYLSDITGGDSQIYQHNIVYKGLDSSNKIWTYFTAQFVSSSSTAITSKAALITYLQNTGFSSANWSINEPYLPTSGHTMITFGNVMPGFVYGIYYSTVEQDILLVSDYSDFAASDNYIHVDTNQDASTTVTITDKVITL